MLPLAVKLYSVAASHDHRNKMLNLVPLLPARNTPSLLNTCKINSVKGIQFLVAIFCLLA